MNPDLSATDGPGPDPAAPRRLVVKLTCGTEAAERANQALTIAATACAAGAQVSLWLAGEASWFAVPGRAAELSLDHAAPAADLLDAVREAGAVTLCTQCAVRRDLTQEDLLPGIRLAGAAAFTEEVLAPGVQALVY
jgi:predicted peroxiredoxin